MVYAREDLADSSTYEETIKTFKVDADYFEDFIEDERNGEYPETFNLQTGEFETTDIFQEDDFDDYKIWLDNNVPYEEPKFIEVK